MLCDCGISRIIEFVFYKTKYIKESWCRGRKGLQTLVETKQSTTLVYIRNAISGTVT